MTRARREPRASVSRSAPTGDRRHHRRPRRAAREHPAELARAGAASSSTLVRSKRRARAVRARRRRLRRRLEEIPAEIERETAAIRARYADPEPRLFPVAVTLPRPAGAVRRDEPRPSSATHHAEWLRWSRSPARSSACRSLTRRLPAGPRRPRPRALAARLRRAYAEWRGPRPPTRPGDPHRLDRLRARPTSSSYPTRCVAEGHASARRRSSVASPSTARRCGPTSQSSTRRDGAERHGSSSSDLPARARPGSAVSRRARRTPRPASGCGAAARHRGPPRPRHQRRATGCSSTRRRARPPAFVTWYATLWLEEPLTLRAFRSLLGVAPLLRRRRAETLEALLDRQRRRPAEVTDQLGPGRAAPSSCSSHALDRADRDATRALASRDGARAGALRGRAHGR